MDDGVKDTGIDGVKIVSLFPQARSGEAHRGPVRELGIRIMLLDKCPISAHSDGVE